MSINAVYPVMVPVYSINPAYQYQMQPQVQMNFAPQYIQADTEDSIISKAQFDKDGTLNLTTARKNCFDSNIWYTIYPDGSGFTQSCWVKGEMKPQGTYSDIYESAKLVSAQYQGNIPDEAALNFIKSINTNLNIISLVLFICSTYNYIVN